MTGPALEPEGPSLVRRMLLSLGVSLAAFLGTSAVLFFAAGLVIAPRAYREVREAVAPTVQVEDGDLASLPEARAGRARVELMNVLATRRGRVDPRLRGLERQLETTGYDGFRVLSAEQHSVRVGERTEFALEGGRRATIELVSRNRKEAHVHVKLFKRNGDLLLDTTTRFKRGRTLLVGGFKHPDGKLVLPVRVDF